jgi:hypothetical protein
MRAFFATLDAGISAFSQGESFAPEAFRDVPALPRALPTTGA